MKDLKEKATKIRKHIVKSTTEAGSGHPGGSLSSADILTYLFFEEMDHNPQNPDWRERDRFVLSKGHAAPLLYATLAEAGYFDTDRLTELRKLGSKLQGHPDCKKLPGVEVSTGSLGQGLSIACGMALAAKIDNQDYRVFTLLGDGESQEGQIWEAAMSASHYDLGNLIAFTDKNKLQIDGRPKEVMDIDPLASKWRSFGWQVEEINGHNFKEIKEAVKNSSPSKPTMIIAHTTKGKGVSFMEDKREFHGKAATEKQMKKGLKELEEKMRNIRGKG